MYKRILLGYDGSESGQQALLGSREIAQWSQAELVLVAVMLPPMTALGPEGGLYDAEMEKAERQRYQAILDAGVQRLAQAGLQARGEVVSGDPVHELAKAAGRLQADLIVVGHKHQDGWAARWWRGSVSKSLIEHAPCSVLVVITR
ncbi:MAG: universal stress protein [Hylemonella sp.]|nr:universal stress protein [Hylemonella sp.]